MKINVVEKTLTRLAELMAQHRFEELETDTLELKPVPADKASWSECHKSACAFLNTRGGIIILGIKEEGTGNARRYVFSGWQPHAEPNVKEICRQFTDRNGVVVDLTDAFPPPIIHDFLGGQVAVLLVDELPADQKYVFYHREAYRRLLTGDHKIPSSEIDRQEEFREEAIHARELQVVEGVTVEDFDLDKLNDYITQLNRPVKVETVKGDLAAAVPFLERKYFLKEGVATTLGMLVCGRHPQDRLGFRCHVHGYVDVPQEIARDKQDLVDNILPLMENTLAFALRNIQIGVSIEQGGMSRPQYPEELLRETVNNALAHRDYTIDRQVILAIKPGRHISITNPGAFRGHLLIEAPDDPIPLRRILPEAKPRNPKLADVLRVFRKWEGRGIGMATLVDLALQNHIDLPHYRLRRDEVTLFLCSGRLLDDRLERLFQAFDQYIADKLSGGTLSQPQKLVLAYLIKSEWANEQVRYTILLTPGNNHFQELLGLERAGLIAKHHCSTAMYPIYVPDRHLVHKDYVSELRDMFGIRFDNLDPLLKDILSVVYRINHFSKAKVVSAKLASFSLWHDRGDADDIRAFDAFYRKVRMAFNKLTKGSFVAKPLKSRGYILNPDGGQGRLDLKFE